MKINEFSKPVPAPGFFARILGRTVSAHALAFVFGAESVGQVDGEIDSAKVAIKEWIVKRTHKDFVMVTTFAPQSVCDAIHVAMLKLCREDEDIAPLLKGIPIELFFNGKQKISI